jgi:hypothetical protein
MSETPRYQDNGDGTITDLETTLQWFREDSWQIETRWFTWDEAFNFAVQMGQARFAGYNDWRLPSLEEGMSLMAPEVCNKDKYDKDIRLDPIFPAGCQATFWSYDGVGQDGYVINLGTGGYSLLYKSKSGRMAARLVRGTPVGLEDIIGK